MPCMLCRSDNEAEFSTEMLIHCAGLKNVDEPGVLVFPTLLVCLDCGSSRFTVLEEELESLASCAAKTARSLTR
jgi:hypothetical protein